MANTQDLLSLLPEFPAAFTDPESAPAAIDPTPAGSIAKQDQTQSLMALVDEFPQAFADPEAASAAPALAAVEPVPNLPVVTETTTALPPGYAQALHRRLATIAWGQIDAELTYGQTGLEQIWITVGKSGTEVQSLCEAIARLVNLLLAQGIPIPAILKELRGIRGGDAEGFGPHRILGLADLIGKVLQEAPPGGVMAAPAPSVPGLAKSVEPKLEGTGIPVAPVTTEQVLIPPVSLEWVNLPTDSRHAAALCPDCGSELHQMNGCSGGACNVCGYSSCS
jgi:hypothetical protein